MLTIGSLAGFVPVLSYSVRYLRDVSDFLYFNLTLNLWDRASEEAVWTQIESDGESCFDGSIGKRLSPRNNVLNPKNLVPEVSYLIKGVEQLHLAACYISLDLSKLR